MEENEGKGIKVARAVVRPIVTVAFSFAVIFFTYSELLSAEVFSGIATTVILFWFRDRDTEKAQIPPKSLITPVK